MEAIGEAFQKVPMEAFRVATQEYGLVGEVEAIGERTDVREVPRAATRQHGQTGGAEIIWGGAPGGNLGKWQAPDNRH